LTLPPAILKKFKDELEDLEHSEILSFLRRLPNMDMDQVRRSAPPSPGWQRRGRGSRGSCLRGGVHTGACGQIITEAYNLKDDVSQSNL